ncbi:AAA family ATPase [candidate division TA06 bacterium]|nr:AAA family ATPase [candidate division TA06 bacterium]
MYESFWGLKEKPFQNTPDPRFLYNSQQHEEALSRLTFAIQERMGATLLTGVFGCGKTIIAYTLLKSLMGEKYKSAYIANPRLDEVDLLRMIVYQLGSTHPPPKKMDVLAVLQEILTTNLQNGKETIVIIDEAHAIESEGVFEEIRLLLNFQLEDKFLLTLLLLGQPELKVKIDKNAQLEQRVEIKCQLEAFQPEDTAKYIQHRLKVAGATRSLFNDDAVRLIHQNSGGIPRRINRLCNVCLLAGYGQKAELIDQTIAQKEISEL